MSRTICFSIDTLLILFCILIGVTVIYFHNQDKILQLKKLYNKVQNNNSDDMININNKEILEEEFIKNRILLNKRDADVLYNNFSPPERRVPEYMYPTVIKNSINIPTRGLPENYQLLGIASRDSTETVFNLFGRQLFPGSNQYEYYVESTNNNNNYKIPISIQGQKEIEDGQEIIIKSTDQHKGPFKVNLYKLDNPRYNPYV